MADKNITINITDEDESLIAKVDQGQSTSVYSKEQIINKYQLNSEQKILTAYMPNNFISDRFTSNVDNGYAITSGYASEKSDQFRQYSANFFLKSNNTFFNISAQPFAKEILFTCGLMSWDGSNDKEGWQKLIAFTENDVPISAPAFNNSSLRELKERIEDYNENALELINKLKIVRYDYKGENTPKNMIGVIVDDDTTADDFKDDSKTAINLYKLNSILIKAFQELSGEVEKIKEQLTTN